MATHLFRQADPKTRAPIVDHQTLGPTGEPLDAAFYFVECDRCGVLNRKGLSRRAAEMRAAAHRCG